MGLLQEAGYRQYRYAAIPNQESVSSSGSSDNSEASILGWPYEISFDPATREGSHRGRSGYKKNRGVRNDNSRSPRLHHSKEALTIVSISPSRSQCASPRRRGIFGFSRDKSKSPMKRPVDEEDFFFSKAQQQHDQGQAGSVLPATMNDCGEEVQDLQELVRTRTKDRFKVTLPAGTVTKTCLRLMKGDFGVEDEYDDIEFVGAERLQNREIHCTEESAMDYRKQNGCRQGDNKGTGRKNQHREEDQVEFLGFENLYKPREDRLQFNKKRKVPIQRTISIVKSLSPTNEKRAANDFTPREKDEDQALRVEDLSPAEDDTHHAKPQPSYRSVRLKPRRWRRRRNNNRGPKLSHSSDDSKNVLDTKTVGKDSESVASVALLCQWLQCAEIEGVDPICSKDNPRGMVISTFSASEGALSSNTTCSVEETDSNADMYETIRCIMEELEEQDAIHYENAERSPQTFSEDPEEWFVPKNNLTVEHMDFDKGGSSEELETILPPSLSVQRFVKPNGVDMADYD